MMDTKRTIFMMRPFLMLIALSVAVSAVPTAAMTDAAATPAPPGNQHVAAFMARDEESEVIVVLDEGADPIAVANEMGVDVTHVYREVFTGFAGIMPARAMAAARTSRTVQRIFEDGRVRADSQAIPTGVRRVDAPLDPDGEHLAIPFPINADIAILDTGVTSAGDLTIAGGVSCVDARNNKDKKKHKKHKKHKKGKKGNHHAGKDRKKGNGTTAGSSWSDDNGHGTHTAGIAAAIDNNQDVVGVAPGARIWAVKVLDAQGSGAISDVICGLDWVVKQKATIDVVNLSLGADGGDGTCQSSAFHRAICSTVNAGIPVVVSAGNDGVDASMRIPASYDEVITVSAMADADGAPDGLGPPTCLGNGDDTFAAFSNFGADIDIAAPGDCIESLTPRGGLQQLSGTSEAAPHVTAAAAVYIARSLTENGVRPLPAQTKAWLLAEASRPQGSPEGFSGDPDGFAEPILWLEDAFALP